MTDQEGRFEAPKNEIEGGIIEHQPMQVNHHEKNIRDSRVAKCSEYCNMHIPLTRYGHDRNKKGLRTVDLPPIAKLG